MGGTVSLIIWDASYSVRVKRFDDDHKRLFSLVNALHDAMKAGMGGKIVQKVVQELADYTKYHFSGEEALMAETQYPALGQHRLQHREFVKKVEQFQRDLRTGAVGQSVAVTTFLKDWLVNHIQRTDREYSVHLNANGWS
jgi:hemerythrin